MEIGFEMCSSCGKEFTKKQYLVRHMKAVHKVNSKGELVPDSPAEKLLCVFCGKMFSGKGSMQRHVDVMHHNKGSVMYRCPACNFTTIHKTNLYRHLARGHKGDRKSKEQRKRKKDLLGNTNEAAMYKCSKCNVQYKWQKSLRFHEKNSHGIKGPPTVKRKCPLCTFTSTEYSKRAMYRHFEDSHNITFTWENHYFDSLDDFYAWKRKIEKQTASFYVRRGCTEKAMDFTCHRSGLFKTRGMEKRSLKKKGSCKINGFCPATVKLRINKDSFYVSYQSCHVGHKKELKHIKLSKEERKFIAAQLLKKTPHAEILRNIRGSLKNCNLYRIGLATIKDIINIENSLNSNPDAIKDVLNIEDSFDLSLESVLDTVEPVSNESWGKISDSLTEDQSQELCSENLVNGNEFMLIFLTNEQKIAVKKYGKDTVCKYVNRVVQTFMDEGTFEINDLENIMSIEDAVTKEVICKSDQSGLDITKMQETFNFDEFQDLENFVLVNCKTSDQIYYMSKVTKELMTAMKAMTETASQDDKPVSKLSNEDSTHITYKSEESGTETLIELDDDDFLLIFFTDEQKAQLLKYGKDMVSKLVSIIVQKVMEPASLKTSRKESNSSKSESDQSLDLHEKRMKLLGEFQSLLNFVLVNCKTSDQIDYFCKEIKELAATIKAMTLTAKLDAKVTNSEKTQGIAGVPEQNRLMAPSKENMKEETKTGRRHSVDLLLDTEEPETKCDVVEPLMLTFADCDSILEDHCYCGPGVLEEVTVSYAED